MLGVDLQSQMVSINTMARERSILTKFSFFNQRGYERFEEDLDGCDDILKGLRRIGQLGLLDEPPPLNLLVRVLHERRIEDHRGEWDRRVSVLERFLNCLGQYLPLKSNVRDSNQMS